MVAFPCGVVKSRINIGSATRSNSSITRTARSMGDTLHPSRVGLVVGDELVVGKSVGAALGEEDVVGVLVGPCDGMLDVVGVSVGKALG